MHNVAETAGVPDRSNVIHGPTTVVPTRPRPAPRPGIGRHRLLVALTGLSALAVANTLYLLANRLSEVWSGSVLFATALVLPKFYQVMLLSHTGLGLLPSILDQIETDLGELGLREAPITVRMTGCPNGCSRPYTADLAFVGRRPGAYNVHVGGGLPGDRIADLYAEEVDAAELVSVIRPLLQQWARQRRDGETLGDFYQRLRGKPEPKISITGNEEPTRESLPDSPPA